MIVTSSDYVDAVEKILAKQGEVSMAVAFWGQGAESLLEGRHGKTRIICNLNSGGTNPEVIKLLRKMPNIELRQHDRLHAKVVLGADDALIGSANLSSNGLNLEGEELRGWEEMGVLTQNPRDLLAGHAWFDALWSKSLDVEDSHIEEATGKWKSRRANRISTSREEKVKGFDLQKLAKQDIQDRDVIVVVYRSKHFTDDAEEAYGVWREDQSNNVPQSSRTPPMYENFRKLPWDCEIIDVYYGKRSVSCCGVYKRALDISFKYKNGEDGEIEIVRKSSKVLGYKFQKTDANNFAALLKPHIEEIWNSSTSKDDYVRYIPLIDIARICT